MTTLDEFYTEVSNEVRRGTSFDSIIPNKVQQAVRWVESQHSFRHMDHYADVALTEGTRSYALPDGFKKMLAWRVIDSNKYFNIKKVDFYDISKITSARPEGYFQDGMDYFWLDSEPDADYDSEMAYNGYTELGAGSTEPFVIQEFGTLVLSQTMVLMAAPMRDLTVATFYKPQRDEMMKAAIDSDVEARQSWQGESVQYGYEQVEHINEIEGDAT